MVIESRRSTAWMVDSITEDVGGEWKAVTVANYMPRPCMEKGELY
jgi:hypothetical protein